MKHRFPRWQLIAGLLPTGLITGLLIGPATPMSAAPMAHPAAAAQHCSSGLGRLAPRRASALGNHLEILSWNIQKATTEGWAEDLANFSDGVDLAFLQEASLQADIESTVQTPIYSSFAKGYATEQLDTGVMTLSSKLPTLRCQLSTTEPWLGTPKATSITEYPLLGRDDRLLAINLHAVNFTLGIEEFRAQFHVLADILSRHEGPVVLAGDLNTWNQRREALVREFLQGHGMQPVEFSDDQRTRAFGRALDHIYVRGMQAQTARVITVSTSDHNALRVGLTIE